MSLDLGVVLEGGAQSGVAVGSCRYGPNYKKLSTNGNVRGGPPYERARTTLFFDFGESSLFEMNHSTLRWGMLHTAAEGETATKNIKEGVNSFASGVIENLLRI